MKKFIFSLSSTLTCYLVLRDILNAPARFDLKIEFFMTISPDNYKLQSIDSSKQH